MRHRMKHRKVYTLLACVIICFCTRKYVIVITYVTHLHQLEGQFLPIIEQLTAPVPNPIEAAAKIDDELRDPEGKVAPIAEQQTVSAARPIEIAATIDEVVEFLSSLARMPTIDLQQSLDPSKKDVFRLSQLEQKICPVTDDRWLPPQPSNEGTRLFRDRNMPTRKQSRHDRIPMLWYEHLSKAGGTSFCKLAKKNMKYEEVPHFFCMPSHIVPGGIADSHVGLWSNKELNTYMRDGAEPIGLWSNKELNTYMRDGAKPIVTPRIVSNEWNPFDPVRFQLQTDADDPSRSSSGLNGRLIFVTTIREPLNRLFSSYTFWPGKMDTFGVWLEHYHRLARGTRVPDKGCGKQVGRYNFATWKFSNGTMPLPISPTMENKNEIPLNMIDYESYGDDWRIPFEDAVRNLARFDLVIPLETLWKHPQPLEDVLGWSTLAEVHEVTRGKTKNSDAYSSMTPDQYKVLWNANRLDIILHAWSNAVYLARLYCGTDGWGLS